MLRHEDIATVAYELYEERERLAREDWCQSEREVLSWINATTGRITHETIAAGAYRRWEDRKGVNGSAQNDWERAIALLQRTFAQAA